MKCLLAVAFCLVGLFADATSAAAQQSASDRAKRWFVENDRDHDGYLTVEEVVAYQLKLLRRMDLFGDGNISPQEYCANTSYGTADEIARCHKQFAAIDANGDGYITAGEVTEYYRLRLQTADVKKDGKVTMDEWLAVAGTN